MAKNSAPKPAGAPSKTPTIGQRLIAALVPRHFKTLSALHMAAQGPAYSTLNNWKNGTAIPDWPSIEAMARLVGRDPLELLGQTSRDLTALRNHPDFVKARELARTRFPNRIPESAYLRAGETHAAQWPEHIDEVFLFNLAQFLDPRGVCCVVSCSWISTRPGPKPTRHSPPPRSRHSALPPMRPVVGVRSLVRGPRSAPRRSRAWPPAASRLRSCCSSRGYGSHSNPRLPRPPHPRQRQPRAAP